MAWKWLGGCLVGVDTSSKKLEAVSKYSAASLPGFSTAYYISKARFPNISTTAEIEVNTQNSDCIANTGMEDIPRCSLISNGLNGKLKALSRDIL